MAEGDSTRRTRPLVIMAAIAVVLALILFVPLPLTATNSGACAEGTSECRDGGTVDMAGSTTLYELLVKSLF